MYRKRTTLLTLNSLTAFPKVCRYPNSYSSIKTLTLLLNFSTAAQRSDFDNLSGIRNEDYIDYKQNPTGFYRNHSGQGGNWDLGGNIGHFRGNPDGYLGGNGKENSTRVYEKSPVYERQQNPVGENGIFLSNNDNINNSSHRLRNRFQLNPDGRNGNFVSINEFQHSSIMQNVNFRKGSYESTQQNSGVIHPGEEGGNGKFSNGYTGERLRNGFKQISAVRDADFSNGGSVGAQQSLNGSNRPNPVLQTSGCANGYGGVSQQNAMCHNVANLGTSQQNSPTNYAGRPGNSRHMMDYCNAGDAGMNQQTLGAESTGNDESIGNDGNMKLTGPVEELDHYIQQGKLDESMKVLWLLEKQGIAVDLPRYLALMQACGQDRAVEEAKSIHEHIMRSIPNLEVSFYNKILEMYCECGSMEDACSVFEKMPHRNLTSWDTLISGLANNGHGENAIELFTEFKELGLKPDGQMYLGVFNACAALPDTTEGMLHFEEMSKDYGIVPSMEHYVSVVGMLGSAGLLDEALEFIEKMPVQPRVEVWETLLHLSRVQGDAELGDRCAELVELLDPSRLNEQSMNGLIPLKASDLSKEKEKKKFVHQNPLEVRSRVHEFKAGDRSDPDHEKLYALLRGLKNQMKEAGYIPETKVVLHDIDQESKEEAVLGHSERLAVAKGFLNTPARSAMRVIKNLRICLDCHNAMKIISKLAGRELIMRDAKRFHHFKDGICSCRDYW